MGIFFNKYCTSVASWPETDVGLAKHALVTVIVADLGNAHCCLKPEELVSSEWGVSGIIQRSCCEMSTSKPKRADVFVPPSKLVCFNFFAWSCCARQAHLLLTLGTASVFSPLSYDRKKLYLSNKGTPRGPEGSGKECVCTFLS